MAISTNQTSVVPSTPVAAAAGATAAAVGIANASATASAQDIQNQFLTLLTTQLQNQDPLNPMDNSEVTSQMAQLSTVSGITQLNATLQAISGQMNMSQSMQASALIGHQVLVTGSKISVGQGVATLAGIDMLAPAADVKATITDGSGRAVRTMDLGAMPAGTMPLAWDGKTDAGAVAPDGAYSLSVSATAADGSSVSAQPLSQATIQSIAYNASGPQINLNMGGSVSLADIRQVI
ncbi:MAG: flagellar hook assembly protein FlgD [Candidimonas sp.]|nr:MAG: flagellar hook assembly protein FlgD [Candidimonas sp.]